MDIMTLLNRAEASRTRVEIGPQEASWILEHLNPGGRRLSLSRTERLCSVMQQGGGAAGPPILFDFDGHLVDGQHRLQAVVLSGRKHEFLVVTGLPCTTSMSGIA